MRCKAHTWEIEGFVTPTCQECGAYWEDQPGVDPLAASYARKFHQAVGKRHIMQAQQWYERWYHREFVES